MRPLASRLKRAVCLFLIFCLLPWQEPARVFASEPTLPAADASATLSLDGLPPDVKSQIDAILRGPNRDAFLANAQKAKLPDIRARLATLAGENVDARDPQGVAARAELVHAAERRLIEGGDQLGANAPGIDACALLAQIGDQMLVEIIGRHDLGGVKPGVVEQPLLFELSN